MTVRLSDRALLNAGKCDLDSAVHVGDCYLCRRATGDTDMAMFDTKDVVTMCNQFNSLKAARIVLLDAIDEGRKTGVFMLCNTYSHTATMFSNTTTSSMQFTCPWSVVEPEFKRNLETVEREMREIEQRLARCL